MTTTPTTHALDVTVLPSRAALGAAAAAAAADHLRAAIADHGRATLMLAAAPSQEATLDGPRRGARHRLEPGHGLPHGRLHRAAPEAPQGFGAWLLTALRRRRCPA